MAAAAEPLIGSEARDESIVIRGEDHSSSGVGQVGAADVEYRRSYICIDDILDRPPDSGCALEEADIIVVCDSGENALAPLYRRERDSNGPSGWSAWSLVAPGSCPGDSGFPTLTLRDFRSLPLAASPVSVQPPSGWTLTGVQTVVHTQAAPQEFTTTLLGLRVRVRATPARFSWNFGDGTAPMVTADPGAPWPDARLSHRYAAPGEAAITLTTSWSGQYQVEGFERWLPVVGYATTVSPAVPLRIHTASSHLVADLT